MVFKRLLKQPGNVQETIPRQWKRTTIFPVSNTTKYTDILIRYLYLYIHIYIFFYHKVTDDCSSLNSL